MTRETGALSHLRVLDLSRILAGPWATQMLGDLGADIIKVERPGTGDDTRGWGPPFVDAMTGDAASDAAARSAYFSSVNRNKRSLAIDITSPEGAAILRGLIPHCDIVVENFKVGGLAKLGLGHEDLMALNPRLIYCSITGFGARGGAHLAGYDLLVQAVSGLMSLTGDVDGPPFRAGVAVFDVLTGLHAALAVGAALRHRERTGQGQLLETNLLSVAMSTLVNQTEAYVAAGAVGQVDLVGSVAVGQRPHEVTLGEDADQLVAVGQQQQPDVAVAHGLGRLAQRRGRRQRDERLGHAACDRLLEAAVLVDRWHRLCSPRGGRVPAPVLGGGPGEAQPSRPSRSRRVPSRLRPGQQARRSRPWPPRRWGSRCGRGPRGGGPWGVRRGR